MLNVRFLRSLWFLIFVLASNTLLTGCSTNSLKSLPSPSLTVTETAIPATRTSTPTATLTLAPSPTASSTSTLFPSETPTPTETPTNTSPPPTPSGEEAIYIYLIQTDTGGPVGCGDTAIPINVGLPRTGDIETDVATALRNLFVKRQYIAGLYNPSYLSNIQVDSVNYKVYSKTVEVMLSGTYVRSKDRCDNSRVRAQVWSTIRQFPGVTTVYILLNGNLLGDILSNN